MGRDTLYDHRLCVPSDFYSHALVGRDLLNDVTVEMIGDFYSHALVGRDGKQWIPLNTILGFLLTRPRGA